MLIIKKENKIISATCDICGADCMKDIFIPSKSDGDRDNDDINKEFEGMVLEANWGYYSGLDGEKWEAVICENCVIKHLTPIINFKKTIT
jgi:hypothetical protein